LLDDCQADPAATGCTVAGLVDAVEAFEHVGQVNRRDPSAMSRSPGSNLRFRRTRQPGSLPSKASADAQERRDLDRPNVHFVGGCGGFYATGLVKILSSDVTVTPLPAKKTPTSRFPALLP
jgi:hypothetical protein